MKMLKMGMVSLSVLCVLLGSGCVTRERVVVRGHGPPTRGIIVTERPPAPQVEVRGRPPGHDHVWISGYWDWRGGRWAWVGGHWESRPHRKAHWEPAHWEHRGRGWVYYEGYWR